LAVLLLLPHLTLCLGSLVPYGAWTTQILPPVINLENYRRLFSEAERLRPLLNSLWMAAASTALAVVLALAAGWLVVRRRVVLRRMIEGLLALPWALPGTVFAIALAITFSVHAPLEPRIVLYTYETRPISIEILSSLRLDEVGVAAAFGVVVMVASALVLGIGARR